MESTEPMTQSAIIPFDHIRFLFGLHQHISGNKFGIGIPVVSIANSDMVLLKPVQESGKGLGVSVAEFPIQQSTGNAIHSCPHPEFLFFLLR